MEIKLGPLNKTAPVKKKLSEADLYKLEQASLDAKYLSEIGVENKKEDTKASHENFIQLPNRKVEAESISIEPNKVSLWPGNPRNFALHVDTSDLEPLIAKGKGNVVPVMARKLAITNKEGNDYEIIAGSRRKDCCAKLNFKLNMSVVDIDDEEALYLTEMENEGRKENDLFAECKYLKFKYDRLKTSDPSLTIEEFAESQLKPVARQTMNDKLKLGEVGEGVISLVKDPHSWSLRKALTLKSYLNKVTEDQIVEMFQNETFKKADQLLTKIKLAFNLKPKKQPTTYTVGHGTITLATSNKGVTTLVLDEKVPNKLLLEIEALIKSNG